MDSTGRALPHSPHAVTAEAAQGHGRVVTVFSATGGIGTTTVAVNLAALLAQDTAHSVCLVDLDGAFHPVATSLGMTAETGLSDAARVIENGDVLSAGGLRGVLARGPGGLWLLAAPDFQPELPQVRPDVLISIVSLLRTMFTHVVIDTPTTFDELVLAAFETSDIIVNVATFGVESLKDLRLTLETLGLLAAPGNAVSPEEGWRVVINRVEPSAGLAAAEAARSLPVPVHGELPLSSTLESASQSMSPLVLSAPEDPFTVALQTFAAEQLAPSHSAGGPAVLGRRGRFSRLRWFRR